MPNEGSVSLREILMEVRQDVKEIRERLPHYVTWRQMWVALAGAASLLVAVIRLG